MRGSPVQELVADVLSDSLVVDEGKHHNSALCHLAANLATRIAAGWRRQERYLSSRSVLVCLEK